MKCEIMLVPDRDRFNRYLNDDKLAPLANSRSYIINASNGELLSPR